MITFLVGIATLIGAYFIYGAYIEKRFGADSNKVTPAISKNDGVDFVPLKLGKIFLIQFLNIAGLGPIFGAIAGALWGPIAFLWIVFGCIFAGSVHDYFSGMLSMRHEGESIAEIIGRYLGNGVKQFMRIFSIGLLVIVGVVFVKGPATILYGITGLNITALMAAVFIYYLMATMIPVDKLIGKIYPFFGLSLLIMAVGLFVALLFQDYSIPNLTFDSFTNMHSKPSEHPVFPLLFITIACGAISGFHSTQSPLMARCISNEKDGRKIFFCAMITEGIVAMIWAAMAMAFFGGVKELGETMAVKGHNAAWVVNLICNTTLGRVGGILALFGVVAAPITSGDTAFRSARLIIADALHLDQSSIWKRLWVTIPLFVIALVLTQIDFAIIWRYMGWANQVLAVIVLWAETMYMYRRKENILFLLLPTLFMNTVVITYIMVAPEGFQLPYWWSVGFALLVTLLFSAKLFFKRRI